MVSTPAFDPADPTWLAHRYDMAADRLLFRHVPHAMHAAGPFLTDELVGGQPEIVAPRAASVEAARDNAGAIHFLFHSAFCASTLLVRALDIPGHSMGLSEPVLLNDITGIHRRGERRGAELAHLLDDALLLLARRWTPAEAVVVKPSNILAGLMTPMMALRPDAHALLLHAPLREFLLSVAHKGLWCRLWARELLEGLLRENLVDLGFEARDYFRLSDLQVAAVGWLAQQRLFIALAERFPDRVRTLDSESLLADPAATLKALADFSMLPAAAAAGGDLAGRAVFSRHSKSGADFSVEARKQERAAATAAYGDEIDKVHDWTLAVADTAAIPLVLPNALLPPAGAR